MKTLVILLLLTSTAHAICPPGEPLCRRGPPPLLSDDEITGCILAVAAGELVFVHVKDGWRVQKAGKDSCGLQAGDVITWVAGERLTDRADLQLKWARARAAGVFSYSRVRKGVTEHLVYRISQAAPLRACCCSPRWCCSIGGRMPVRQIGQCARVPAA